MQTSGSALGELGIDVSDADTSKLQIAALETELSTLKGRLGPGTKSRGCAVPAMGDEPYEIRRETIPAGKRQQVPEVSF